MRRARSWHMPLCTCTYAHAPAHTPLRTCPYASSRRRRGVGGTALVAARSWRCARGECDGRCLGHPQRRTDPHGNPRVSSPRDDFSPPSRWLSPPRDDCLSPRDDYRSRDNFEMRDSISRMATDPSERVPCHLSVCHLAAGSNLPSGERAEAAHTGSTPQAPLASGAVQRSTGGFIRSLPVLGC